MKTDAPKDPNMGGIVGQIAKGGDGLGRYVINCYSRVDRLEAKHNDVGGIAGIVSDDSFVINCYSTVEKITANSSYASVVGYSKKGNLQNIYGNSACPSKSAANSAVGSDKAARNGLEKDDLRSALARRDEVGRRHRTFERRVVRKLRRSAQRRRGALQRHSGGNAAGQARRRPAQVDGIGELSRTGKITLQENRNFPVLPF